MAISFIVLVLYLRFVQAQYIPSECQSCGCCKPGQYRCFSDGYCRYGCLDGYWSTSCTLKCKYMNCKRCAPSDGNFCLECKTGFYDNECGSSCATNCEGCLRQDGSCYSCVNRYWGKYCNSKCGDQCETCNRSKGCTECNTGYYCSKCEKNCGDYCASCAIQNGCTACTPGYYSDDGVCKHCQNKNTGCVCTSYYNCVGCTNGYFLNIDNCLHCPNYCTSCISATQCTSCRECRFGNTCQHQCTSDCDNGYCDSLKATCQCNAYYVGEECNQCVAGYYGNGCKQRCSVGCSGSCNQSDGSCTCKIGWAGDKCDTCAYKYCNDTSINCNSCRSTFYFANDNECCLCHLENCVSCAKLLDTFNCKICRRGYFPHTNGQCAICNSQCVDNECDSSSGRCLQGCVNGYWNHTCENECDPECLSCNQADGSCLQCKNKTKYGPYCRQECNPKCTNSVCDMSGNCTNGCLPNTYGKQCENTCDESCTPMDNKTRCSEQTGICLYGCQTGNTGVFCPQDVENASEEKTTTSAALGGGIGCGIAGLIIIAILGMLWFRKRRRSNTEHNDLHNNDSLHDSQRDYATVDANLRAVELKDIEYDALQGTDVHTMAKTTEYSNVSEKLNDNMTYENVCDGPLP